ncbi:type VII secretion protein EccC [Actinocatenispora sera]|uniref:Type VII secretion protein EccC n=1 Tax=Actinocatenispora sera TaxID=390989 RepID=A0A810LAY5_9ACTN|nr:type VII secretion protein EccC [Actinocatenispora sera]BCJ32427.1 type VII secretion protein EccC [Actinocatenispora sera]
MGTEIVKRPPRRPSPELPSGEVILDPPPEAPQPNAKGWQRMMMILPMAAGAAAMGLMMGTQRGGPMAYVAGGMYGVSILGMIAVQLTQQGGGQSKKEMIEARRQFMRKLSQLRAQVRNTIEKQREAMYYRHPDPGALWSTAASGRLWERRSTDGDFAVVRIGLGPQEIATPLVPPQTRSVDELEPLCAMALRRFVTTYSIVPDLPVAMALRGFSRVYLRGSDQRIRGLVRAMLGQYGTFHAPDDALLGLCVSDDRRAAWDWAKWLPHALHPTKVDAVGQLRLVAPTVTALEAMLDDVLVNRPRFDPTAPPSGATHLVVVIDGGDTAGSDHLMTEGGVEGVTIIDLTNPPPRLLDQASLVLDVANDGTMTSTTMDGTAEIGTADGLDPVECEALVRQLSALRLSAASLADQPMSGELGLAELLNIGDPYEFDLGRTWATRPNRDRLRVPLGIGPDGRPVELDLKESAQDGMGPHGLLVGATGSGKSELLRTLVLALSVTHSSEVLNFVLVDFKGGATFTTLDRLPHTSAVITNLEDELSLVDRMLDAIQGELIRRQELLRSAGNYASQRDYERARAAGVPLAPLPSLLIICDEFSELLTAKPDFIDMFVQIGRVGRSLGVHLLLASQRLEEGRLRGLDTHLSYRIGLRTFSSMESRSVLGVPDAYELPRSPGHGYLKAGTEGLVRFRAAYVSGRYRRGVGNQRREDRQVDPVQAYSTWYATPPVVTDEKPAQTPEQDDDVLGETLLDVVVARLEGQGVPAHQVWLPPLAEPPTLDQILPPLSADPRRGLTVTDPELLGTLRGVAGIIDKPFEQRRDLLWTDLSGATGNVVVVGGPQTGKSTIIRTLMGSLALTHTPREVQFYCLDFGGGGLSTLRELPHVGGNAGRMDTNQVRRTVAELRTLLAEREARFTANGIDSMATYRRMKRDGKFTEDRFGDVFLVIDGLVTLRNEFEDLEPGVTELANRGLGYGIHLIVTCTRWMEMRPAVRDMFGTRLELRLGDPADSEINRRAALNVPTGTPGRGLTHDALHFLAGLPRIDGQQDAGNLTDGIAKFVQTVRNEWRGEPAPRVRLLPDRLPYEALPAAGHDLQRGIPIGIAENDLQPVYLDFAAEPHFLLFGDIESGKSTFLRSLARSISERYTPAEAKVMMIDLRRSLLGSLEGPHLIGYGHSTQVAKDMIRQVVEVMKERLPGPNVTPEQLRDRSWWKGPELYVLVDDYDLVATGPSHVLSPLTEFLAQSRDIGLHVILARRVGGASRALYEPMMSRIRELASPGITMSGPREEGALLGNVKPQLLPPGRGWLTTRRHGNRLVQLAWLPPVV